MANSAGDAHEFPIYGYHFRATFPILDNTGSLVTGAAGLDSEFSNDAGTFADCTNEATEIATSSGIYYLDIIGTEMDAKQVAVIIKTSTVNAKTTVLVLYPERLCAIKSGTAAGGGASTITMAASTSKQDNDLAGLYVGITNNSPAGVQYQVRKIISNVASTQVATVDSAWGTNPDNTSTYDLLSRASVNATSFGGTMPSSIATAGIQDVNVKNMNNVSGSAITTIKAVQGLTTADTIVTVSGNVSGNVVGSVGSVTGNVGGNVTGSVGSVTGNVGGNVTGTVASVVGNVGGNVVGTVASVVGNVGGNIVGNLLGTLSTTERDAIATALLDLASGVETSITVRQTFRAMGSALAGNVTGTGSLYAALGNSGTGRLTVVNPTADTRTVTPSL